jgi:type II secretory pathway pseudopilin PulG
VNPATEKRCPHCQAIIPFGADVCPQCGARLTVPPAAGGGGAGKVLKGCLIAAVVAVVGVFVIGIVAAIVIPKFASTKQRAYVAEMKSDLRNLATAEEAYRQGHSAYTPNIGELAGFTLSSGVALARPIDASADGWSATVKRDPSGMECTIGVGDRVPAGGTGGTPVCGPERP